MAKEIGLTKGFVALVDDEDFEYLSQFKWRYNNGYAARAGYDKVRKKQLYIGMHQVVLERKLGRKLIKGEIPEHKNRNRSDNTRDNVRLATQSKNLANISKYPAKSSRFKGVYRHNGTGKWQAQIMFNRKLIYIGLFDNEELAAKAYDQHALVRFGEFAQLNFPDEPAPQERNFNGLYKERTGKLLFLELEIAGRTIHFFNTYNEIKAIEP